LRNRLPLALLTAASLIALWPAFDAASARAPESILPPGFGEPEPKAANTVDPVPETADTPVASDTSVTSGPAPAPTPRPSSDVIGGLIGNLSDADNAVAALPPPLDLPPEARRSLDYVGLLSPGDGGLAETGYGATDGRFLSTLMRSIDAPIASRWASILLRRSLLSPTPIPAGIDGADWVAERAWLLLRMGEADNARALVARVDAENFTPKLFQVAMQAALATGDPAALCGIADRANEVADEPGWPLAQAMCAGLSGEPGTASALIDRVRDRRIARGIDVLLAEKVVGAAANTRRAVMIQWDDIAQLTAWRYGMATATGVTVPPALYATVGPQVVAWQARAPLASAEARAQAAERAATLGVFSSTALVDFQSAIWGATDPADRADTTADRLRLAYVGDVAARLNALRNLWVPAEGGDVYARRIMTARAAAGIPVGDVPAEDADRLVGSMFAAGLDTQAQRWADTVASDGLAWAMVAVGAPRAIGVGVGDVNGFASSAGGDDNRRTKFLIAGLAGLGRLTPAQAESLAEDHEVPLGRESSWSRALDRAVAANEPASVVLIAAAGLQTREWRYVPPHHLYRIVSALRRVGFEPEARMIAAEALARA